MKTKILKPIWLQITIFIFLIIVSSCQKQPDAAFISPPSYIKSGETVSFTNLSFNADRYEWDFGDGNTLTTTNPAHAYDSAGTYTITLTAYSKNNKKKHEATATVTVIEAGSYTDTRDDRIYTTVKIGNQWWMAENLNYYTNSGSWYYNLDSSMYSDVYGKLYDWNTAGNACPSGWHLPTYTEWSTLIQHLGGEDVAYAKLRETGTAHWTFDDGSSNSSLFTALPGGTRWGFDGSFSDKGFGAYFWSSTPNGSSGAFVANISSMLEKVDLESNDKTFGCSVRCVKD